MGEQERLRDVRRVLWRTLALNVIVACAKIAYGYTSGALSIRADGFHSLTDSTNNLVGLCSLWVAARAGLFAVDLLPTDIVS